MSNRRQGWKPWLHPREAAKFLNMEVGDEDEDMDMKDDDDKKMIERRAKWMNESRDW